MGTNVRAVVFTISVSVALKGRSSSTFDDTSRVYLRQWISNDCRDCRRQASKGVDFTRTAAPHFYPYRSVAERVSRS